jgi:hypothetical protein
MGTVNATTPQGTKVSLDESLAKKLGWKVSGKASGGSASDDVELPEGDPSDAWTVKQLTKYAADNEIQVDGKTKADYLAAINAN